MGYCKKELARKYRFFEEQEKIANGYFDFKKLILPLQAWSPFTVVAYACVLLRVVWQIVRQVLLQECRPFVF
jgi:hypothetical protein